MALKEKLAGKFIVFDGPDGSGKGTQIRMLTEHLEAEGLRVVYGQEPGGTVIGNQIRDILLHKNLLHEMDVRCEAMLFMASRGQLVGEVVEPAIASGAVVLCDRFISATCAYQGAAGYDPERVVELGHFAVGRTWPDLTIILDVTVEQGFERNAKRHTDAMEARPNEFHEKVRQGFLNLPASYPGRVEVIDGMADAAEVYKRVLETLQRVDF